MPSEWTMIRVREETANWLRREAAHIAGLAVRGMVEQELTDRVGNQQGCGVSVDAVLRRLIHHVEADRKRSRKRRGIKRAQRMSAGGGVVVEDVAGDVQPAEVVS